MYDNDQVYLGDGEYMNRSDYARLTRGGRYPTESDVENYQADIVAFEAAGFHVAEGDRGAVVDGRFLIARHSRSWRNVTGPRDKYYRYSSADSFIDFLRTGVWRRTASSIKASERRQAALAAKDRKRRVAYEREWDAKLAKGKPLPRGGVSASGPHESSGFFGVAWNSSADKWNVNVSRPALNGQSPPPGEQNMHVGFFDDVIEAACAFDDANVSLRGRYARTNFPKNSRLGTDGDTSFVETPCGRKISAVAEDDRHTLLKPQLEALTAPKAVIAKRPSAPSSVSSLSAPEYSSAPCTVDPAVLAQLGVGSVEELVNRYNEAARQRKRFPISQGDYPTTKSKFERLVKNWKALNTAI